MDFTQLNWAGWTILALQLITVLLTPALVGAHKNNDTWTYSDFITALLALILSLFAFRII